MLSSHQSPAISSRQLKGKGQANYAAAYYSGSYWGETDIPHFPNWHIEYFNAAIGFPEVAERELSQ
jgi:hypothetical protein